MEDISMFIGRKEEVQEIRSALKSDKAETILIYGRRVGKSENIRQSLLDCDLPTIYSECKKTSSLSNLENLVKVFSDTFSLTNLSFKSFDDFFDYVFKYSIQKKYVLVIDEFSFLLENDFSIESSLAIAINRYKKESMLKLVLSGSYVTLITKMIEFNSHCYGRFNHILLIKPFDYFLSSFFYPDYSNEDKIKRYSIFGIPYFNSLIDPKKSADSHRV